MVGAQMMPLEGVPFRRIRGGSGAELSLQFVASAELTSHRRYWWLSLVEADHTANAREKQMCPAECRMQMGESPFRREPADRRTRTRTRRTARREGPKATRVMNCMTGRANRVMGDPLSSSGIRRLRSPRPQLWKLDSGNAGARPCLPLSSSLTLALVGLPPVMKAATSKSAKGLLPAARPIRPQSDL